MAQYKIIDLEAAQRAVESAGIELECALDSIGRCRNELIAVEEKLERERLELEKERKTFENERCAALRTFGFLSLPLFPCLSL